MTPGVPTRWRHLVHDQLDTAAERVARAEGHGAEGEGTRAMQELYPAVVTLATIHVWLDDPPWESDVAPDEMHRRVQNRLPNLFAALTELDVQHVLTRPWAARDAVPYLEEARTFLDGTRTRVDRWIEGG
jgi:hypothetical protein